MDKKRILASLNEVATSLENSGFYNEADEVTVVMKKVAQMPVAPISKNMRIPASAKTPTKMSVNVRFGSTASNRAPTSAPATEPIVSHNATCQLM